MSRILPVGITGMGVALPPHVRTNDFWRDKLTGRTETQRRDDILAVERGVSGAATALSGSIQSAMAGLDDVFRGAERRRVLDEGVELAELEATAAKAALADAGARPEDIDLLLVHSLPNDFATPLNAPAVQHKVGLTRAVAWNLEVGCGSFLAQLVAASGLVHGRLFRRALIVQSAAMSRILDFSAPMSIGFGDAAVAAVVDLVPEGYGLVSHASSTDGSLRDGVVLASTETSKARDTGRPDGDWWRGRGHVVLTSLDPQMGKSMGIEGPRFCKETCTEALERAELTLDDVDWFVCNQSVGWFVEACRAELGISKDKTVDTFKEVANIGAGAILYNLAELRSRGLLKDGHTILLYQPSAGFTRSAAVVRWRAAGPEQGRAAR